MPVVFNEPLSFLQRMTEYMEYARLLRCAAEQDDPVERMKFVAGECSMWYAFLNQREKQTKITYLCVCFDFKM